jgi:putative tryptophan/tyrosine transport system substrate-binding protein
MTHNRRDFSQTVVGGLLGLCLPAALAQTAPAKVGWLMLSSSGPYSEITARGFVQGLREGGFVEGNNLVLERRSAEGDTRRLAALARELVAARVDVLFAPAKPMADAAWYASRRIPTVIATVTDPVVVDYAVSLARPGKHITGVTTANAELIGKRMQLLTELVPGLKRLGTFIDPQLLDSCTEELTLMDAAAARLGIVIVRIPVKVGALDIEDALRRAQAAGVQAVMTAPMTGNLDVTDKIALQAARLRLPFVHDVPQLAGDALAVYGPDFEDVFRRAGLYVARILKGEKPAEMAIEQPREFKLILNDRAARGLGIALPQGLKLRADQVID